MASSRLPSSRQREHRALNLPAALAERPVTQLGPDSQPGPLRRRRGDRVRELRLRERLAPPVTAQAEAPQAVVEPPGHRAAPAVRATAPQLRPERGLGRSRLPGPRLQPARVAHRAISPYTATASARARAAS